MLTRLQEKVSAAIWTRRCMETRSHSPSVPASVQSQSLPHSIRHSEPRWYPQGAQANPGTATPPTPKNASARWNQSPPAKTPTNKGWTPETYLPDSWLAQTNPRAQKHPPPSPSRGSAANPLSQPGHPNAYPECPQGYHRICAVQAPNPVHRQEDQNKGLISYNREITKWERRQDEDTRLNWFRIFWRQILVSFSEYWLNDCVICVLVL